jgi:hypothetical protein
MRDYTPIEIIRLQLEAHTNEPHTLQQVKDALEGMHPNHLGTEVINGHPVEVLYSRKRDMKETYDRIHDEFYLGLHDGAAQ